MFKIFTQRPVWIYAGAFVLFAACAFAYYMATGKGFVFYILTVPWGFVLPASLTGSAAWDTWVYPVSWVLIVINAPLFGALVHAASRKAKETPNTEHAQVKKSTQVPSGPGRAT